MSIESAMIRVDKALAILPLNENKTLVSSLVHIIFPVLAAKFPPLLLISPIVDAITSIGMGIGLLHKTVKMARKKEE